MDIVAPIIIERFRVAHGKIRDNIADLDAACLNWMPGPETSSIAIVIKHIAGFEREALRMVLGQPSDRDRPTEFVVGGENAADVLRSLDTADAVLDELGGKITPSDLAAERVHPRRGGRPGLDWLVDTFGHLREHQAQIDLTKQLYLQQQGS